MIIRFSFLACVALSFTTQVFGQSSVRLVTDRSLELTGYQSADIFRPGTDFRNDFAMVYGAYKPNLPEMLKAYTDRGYVPHVMTGIAWGPYDGFHDLHGNGIQSLCQVQANGDRKLHGRRNPYIVPSVEFADYVAERLKPVIDAGVLAIHLEEPEFWAYTGFSEAFEREWELYYREPFVRPDSTADAQYKASQLKYYLYDRTIRRVAEACKEYAYQKYQRQLRVYVPTHSLINYTHWRIVSPQSSLIDSSVVDGCIAQVWTGTARQQNVYQGKQRERTFETAFLEYGCMQELVRGTDRRMWFLHDPIEDNANRDWNDFRENYQATLVASLLHPKVWHYEICPWPRRIFFGSYPRRSFSPKSIPPDYATTLCTVFNQLRDMQQADVEWINATPGIGVLLADSAMFQRGEPVYQFSKKDGSDPTQASEGDVRHFSAFYGMTLPLLKRGIPVQPVQLDNVVRFTNYLDGYKVLLLSYEFMKPQSPAINQALAQWVRDGGNLVYVGADTDPFNRVSEFWNTGQNSYSSPAEHLLKLLGLEQNASNGIYACGAGHLFVARNHPAYYTRSQDTNQELWDLVSSAAETAGIQLQVSNFLQLNRGPYVIAACLEESVSDQPLKLRGRFVDILNSELPVVQEVNLQPGERAWLMDLDKLEPGQAEPIASAARFETWQQEGNRVLFTHSAPTVVRIVSRLRLPKSPQSMIVDGQEFKDYVWDEESKTLFYESPAFEQTQEVRVEW